MYSLRPSGQEEMAGESLDALPVGDVVQRHVVEVAEVAEREEVVFLVRCSAFDGDEEQVVGISDADGFADIVRTVFSEAKTFGNVSLQSVREVGQEIHEARVKRRVCGRKPCTPAEKTKSLNDYASTYSASVSGVVPMT